MPETTDASTIQWSFQSPLARPDWDLWTRSLPGWTGFHGQDWARVIAEVFDYECTYLIGIRDNRPDVLLPLMRVRSWLTGRRGVGLPFTDECPALLRDPADWPEAQRRIAQHSAADRWRYIEIRGLADTIAAGPPSLAYHGHAVNLPELGPDWLNACASSHRRLIRKAQQASVEVTQADGEENIGTFYRLFCQTRRRHGAPPQPEALFLAIHRHMISRGRGWMWLAHHQQQAIAAAIFIGDKTTGTVTYRFGASLPDPPVPGANHLVMASAIGYFRQQGFKRFDFGRTSTFNAGLTRFKDGWGTRRYPIHYHRWLGRTFVKTTVSDLAGGAQSALFKRLPITMAKLTGRLLYRHIA